MSMNSEELLRAIATSNPLVDVDGAGVECGVCHLFRYEIHEDQNKENHASDCLWVQAQDWVASHPNEPEAARMARSLVGKTVVIEGVEAVVTRAMQDVAGGIVLDRKSDGLECWNVDAVQGFKDSL